MKASDMLLSFSVNWLIMAIFPLFLSICLSVYSGYLRKKFRINPISIKKAFKSSDDSYFRFREQNNSKIGKLAYLQRMMLVIIGLGYLISLALFLSIFLELINRNPLIRTAPFALFAVSLTLIFDILLQSTSKKKLILQIMEYQHLKAKESLTAPIKDFFGSKQPLISMRLFTLGMTSSALLIVSFFCLFIDLTQPLSR